MKWFCPHCGGELTSNRAGETHVRPEIAWLLMECEYQVGDFSASMPKNYPVSELERERERLQKFGEACARAMTAMSLSKNKINALELELKNNGN